MIRRIVALAFILGAAAFAFLAFSWWGEGPTDEETGVIVTEGTSISTLGAQLAERGQIGLSPGLWRLNTRLFGGSAPIQAGEFTIPPGTRAAATATPTSTAAASPPRAPDQVLLGETAGASFGPPNARPAM